jgi:DNA transformation protein
MPVTDGFIEFVIEQLDPVGPITPKRMFGGVGLYAGDVFFGLIAGDVLYLKTDETVRAVMKKAGAKPFQPYPGQGRGKTQYYSVPVSVLEDSDTLAAWTKRSIAITGPRRAKALRYR